MSEIIDLGDSVTVTDIPNTVPDGRVELPGVVSTDTNQHVSVLLVEDGLAQVEEQLKVVEEGINEVNTTAQQLNEKMTNLQARKIAVTAQKNLLLELKTKITEFSGFDSTSTLPAPKLT